MVLSLSWWPFRTLGSLSQCPALAVPRHIPNYSHRHIFLAPFIVFRPFLCFPFPVPIPHPSPPSPPLRPTSILSYPRYASRHRSCLRHPVRLGHHRTPRQCVHFPARTFPPVISPPCTACPVPSTTRRWVPDSAHPMLQRGSPTSLPPSGRIPHAAAASPSEIQCPNSSLFPPFLLSSFPSPRCSPHVSRPPAECLRTPGAHSIAF